MDRPVSVVLGHQSHRLPAQGFTQVDPPFIPLDLSIGPDPSHGHPGLVLRGVHPLGIGTYRRLALPSWRLLTQRFMGSLLVVAGTKGLEGTLLPLPRGLGRTCCLRLQRPVEPLQPPVLFRMSRRLDTLWKDPQLDPPHSQGRQSAQANAGKGRTVVGADGPRETVLPEGSFKDRAHLRTSGLAQPVARQEIPGGGILHGKGVDPCPISSAEPALEVDTPEVIGLLRLDKGLAPRRCPAASLAPAHQPSPVQQVSGRTGGRPGNPWLPVLQPGHQLLGAPRWVLLPSRDQALHDRPLRLVGMPMRRPAQVSQTIPSPGLKAMDPFVAGLRADAKGLARFQAAFSPSLPSLYEPDLFHFTTRIIPRHHFPPHSHLPSLLGKCYLCSRFKCYQSTRFVPLRLLSHKWKGGSLTRAFLPG